MEDFPAGQECTAVLVCILLVVLGVVRIKPERWQGYSKEKKHGMYHQIFLNREGDLMSQRLQGFLVLGDSCSRELWTVARSAKKRCFD